MRILLTTRISGALSLLLLLSTLPAFGTDKEQREPHEPAFSADGTQLAYREDVTKAGEVLSSSSEICIVNRDGTGARALTSGAKDQHPRFSPDGKFIAFTRDQDIWIVSTDGSNLRNITNTKDATESKAEFTLRGDLVFLREARDKRDDEAWGKALAKDPWAALGRGVTKQRVVWRRMDDGSERDIVGNGYEVVYLEPNPIFDDAVFIICKPLDNDGKPVKEDTENKVIAVAKLDGTLPRTVSAPKPETKTVLQELHIRNNLNFVVARWPEKPAGGVALLKDGEIVPLPDAPIFGDVSRDGKTIAGIGIVKGQASLFGLVLHDIETKVTHQLFPPQ
jgi:dipeptidyl aminopeptidase/acylaminoacyl peptidase